jgi:hypothetical protein
MTNYMKPFGSLDPGFKKREHFSFANANFIQLYNAISMLSTCPRTQGYSENHFSALIVDLAGDQTRATCVAPSGANRSASHYDFWHGF